MALLTQEEIETIEQHPFGDKLIDVRKALRGAEPPSPHDASQSQMTAHTRQNVHGCSWQRSANLFILVGSYVSAVLAS